MVLAQNALVVAPALLRFFSVAYFWLCASVLVLLAALAVFFWRFDGLARVLERAVYWGVRRVGGAGGKLPDGTVLVEDVEELLASTAAAGRGSPLRHRHSLSSRPSLSSPGKMGRMGTPGNTGSTGDSGKATGQKPTGGNRSRTARRIVAKDIRVSQAVLKKLDFGAGMRTSGVQVDEVGVWVPSWQQPLKLVVSGVKMCIVCVEERGRKSDPRSPAYALEEARQRKQEEALRRNALGLIDEILWGAQQEVSNQVCGPGLAQRLLGRLRSGVFHAIARAVMRSVHVEFRDVRVIYLQQGEPGPRPSLCKYSGRDAAELRVRSVVLEPNESGNESDERSAPCGIEGGAPSEAIVASRLGLSGISLDLLTYPDTWEMADVSELPGSSMPSPTRGSRTTSFSFPKYAKTGTSTEREKMERLKGTAVYGYFELSGDAGCNLASKLALADEEVHRVINQWEVSAVLSVLPSGVVRVSHPSSSCCHGAPDRYDDGNEDDDGGEDGGEYEDGVLGEAATEVTTRGGEFVRTNSSALALTIDVDIKALMLDVNLSSLGIAQRLKGRMDLLSKYNAHWSARPDFPVISNEIIWWQHAGGAALEEVRRRVRWQVPLGRDVADGIEQRRANRLVYEPLYLAKHSRSSVFRDPNRRWYQRNTLSVADDAGMNVLARMEERLSVEEVGHFRFMAAAKYNHVLASSPDMKEFLASKVDYVISQLARGHLVSRDTLLHLDCLPKPERAFALDLSLKCPKISLALDTRLHATAEVGSVAYYACSVKHLHVGWKLGGGMRLFVKSMSIGPAGSSAGEMRFLSVTSPSLLCHRVCKAADFTRYAVTGQVRADNIASDSVDTAFIEMDVDPTLGLGGVTVDSCVDGCGSVAERIKNWKPAGLSIHLSMAAIGARMTTLADHSDYSRVLLRLIGRYRRSKTYMRRWKRAAEPFSVNLARGAEEGGGTRLAPSRSHPNARSSFRYRPLNERFASIADLVEDSCSRSLTPTMSMTKLANNTIRVECPGIAFQVPYFYKYSLSREMALQMMEAEEPGERLTTKTRSISTTIPRAGFDSSKYMLTVVVQNIRLTSHADSFASYYSGGAALIAEGGFMVDLFSYLSDDERNAISENLAPMKYVFDEEAKEFRQVASGVDVLRRKLRHLEIVSMAKVWAYPEDASLIARAARPRTPSLDLPEDDDTMERERTAEKMRLPAIKLLEKSRYPVPIVPYFKTYGTLGCVASRVSGEPVVPGDKSTSVGVFIRGIQAWMSPIQLGHLKCLTETIQDKLRSAGDALVERPEERDVDLSETTGTSSEIASPEACGEGGRQPDDHDAPTEELGRSSRQLLRAKVHVQQASIIWMIGTWASRDTKRGGARAFMKKSWDISVERDDPAFIWGQWLAPLYGISVSGLKLSMRQGDVSGLAVQGSVRAVIARDLQLSELARHAYVLRPLPVRAKRVFERICSLRREALGVTQVRKSVQLWKLAIAVSLTRQAVNIGDLDDTMTQLPSLDDTDLDSSGSQFKFDYDSGSPGTDERGSLVIDVGQLLAYIRVKQNASLAAFLGQVSANSTVDSKKSRHKTPDAVNKKVLYQRGLKVVVNMVGLDVTGRFQSSDLVLVRLHQGYLALDQQPVSRYSNPGDMKMHLSAKVDNLMVFDLRATEEHQFVLSPSHDARSCAVTVHMTKQVDGSRYAPRLSVDITNPRIILLFRFVRDLLDGISLITTSLKPDHGAEQRRDPAVQLAEDSEIARDTALPMQMTVNARDIDLVVPTSRKERSVLYVSMRELVVALPGVALPVSTLADAQMPGMDAIVEESILCSSTFLYGNFTRERAKDQDAGPADDSDEQIDKEEVPIQARGESDGDIATETDNRSKPRGRRAAKRKGKVKKAELLSGVLLFEDQYDMRANDNAKAGVLQLPEDHSGELDVEEIDDHHDDNILKRSAMFGKPYEILQSAFKEVRGQKSEASAPVPAVDNIEGDSTEAGIEACPPSPSEDPQDDVSDPTLAMCISEMKISCGVMTAIPAEKLTDTGTALARTATLTTNRRKFVLYDVVHEHQLIEPINMVMAMFERNCHTQLHLSLSEFRAVLSNPIYSTVMDFVSGNLGDLSGHADDHIVRFKEIRYNKGMNFGPANSSSVGFRFTLATPEVDCLMSAPPTEWMGDGTEYFSNIKESAMLPFFDVNVANFIMNVASMDSGDTYMNFCSTRIDVYDLRLGYRLHKISSDISALDLETVEAEEPEPGEDSDPIASSFPARRSTVARKISDHSLRHKDSLKHIEFAAAARVRADDHVDIQSQNFGVPLIDFTRNPGVRSIIGEDVACYRLLTTDVAMKDREHAGRIPGSNGNIRFEASVGILEDSTMAIELALSGALIQYPYFHDVSLVNGVVGIFRAEGSSEQHHDGDDLDGMFTDISPWMYLNVIITDTEIFVPVVDVDIALKLIGELWEYAPDLRLSEFEKVADVMLATALIHSTDSSAILSLEDRGMAVDMALLRFCYAMGGDGEIKMTTDLANVAALIRDPNARVHTVIQPLSASFDLSMQQPESVERHEHRRMTQAAIKIQRAWRQHYLETRISSKLNAEGGLVDDSFDSKGVDKSGRESADQWKLVEKLALDVATPRTRELLEDYYAGKGQVGAMSRSIIKALSVQTVNVRLGMFTCRMAFSHVAFWKTAAKGISVLASQVSSGVEPQPVEKEFDQMEYRCPPHLRGWPSCCAMTSPKPLAPRTCSTFACPTARLPWTWLRCCPTVLPTPLDTCPSPSFRRS